MQVKLLEHTPEPERVVAAAARLCYAPIGADQLFDKLTKKEIRKLLNFLIESGHHSAIEHAVFTFAIEGISRACSHQLVRHRLASYSQQSQRYVKFLDKLEFVVPKDIKRKPNLRKLYEEINEKAFEGYKKLIEEGVNPEDARYLLPNAAETKIVVTMNARELFHFFTLRCCDRAQWEIRDLANKMLKEAKKIAPIIFEDAGPACLRGPCPEGPMICGNPRKRIKRKKIDK
ncbi:MAG: FAD-dependent thymidylate synthase [Actinobacteria bacterium]|nr:FAD-dependent thymidylate synthase [Actinomycetota bacterium]